MKASSRVVFTLIIVSSFLFWILFSKNHKMNSVQGITMGSTYEIKYLGDSLINFQKDLDNFDFFFSTYKQNSFLSKFNNMQKGCLSFKNEDKQQVYFLKEMLIQAKGFNNMNDFFDISLEPIFKLWGFNSLNQIIPTQEQINQISDAIGMDKIQLQEDKICKLNDKTALNFNAMGAGFIIDYFAQKFEQENIHDYMINITGEIRAKGKKNNDTNWLIAIEKPQNKQEVYQIISVDDFSLSVSGNYRSFWNDGDHIFSHTFNKEKLAPIENQIDSVVVLHRYASYADAYSTMILAMSDKSLQEIIDFIEKNKLAVLLLKNNQDPLIYKSYLFEQMTKK